MRSPCAGGRTRSDRQVLSTPAIHRKHGGRRWWAHLVSTRMNVSSISPTNQIEERIEISFGDGIACRILRLLEQVRGLSLQQPSER
jgi:hypothetical protein